MLEQVVLLDFMRDIWDDFKFLMILLFMKNMLSYKSFVFSFEEVSK